MTFDTLAIAKRLRAAGFTEPQAEAMTAAISDGRQFELEQLATKSDLATLKTDLTTDLAELRAATRADFAVVDTKIAQLEVRLVKWLAGVLITQVAAVIGVVVSIATVLLRTLH